MNSIEKKLPRGAKLEKLPNGREVIVLKPQRQPKRSGFAPKYTKNRGIVRSEAWI